MNDQLLIDRSLINRIHATAKQGQSTRDLHLGSICCKDIERMCLWALQNGFENGVAKRSGWQMKGKVELIYLSDDIVGTAWINGDECRLEFINDKTGDKYFPTDNELAVVHDVVWELVEKRIAERDSDEPFTIDASTFHI